MARASPPNSPTSATGSSISTIASIRIERPVRADRRADGRLHPAPARLRSRRKRGASRRTHFHDAWDDARRADEGAWHRSAPFPRGRPRYPARPGRAQRPAGARAAAASRPQASSSPTAMRPMRAACWSGSASHDHFDDLHDIHANIYRPKPDPHGYATAVRALRHRSRSTRCWSTTWSATWRRPRRSA